MTLYQQYFFPGMEIDINFDELCIISILSKVELCPLWPAGKSCMKEVT